MKGFEVVWSIHEGPKVWLVEAMTVINQQPVAGQVAADACIRGW